MQDPDDGVDSSGSCSSSARPSRSARVWLTEYAYQTNPPDVFGVSPRRPGSLHRGVAPGASTQAPKVDMLIHYLYRDEPELARWQSGLETVDGEAKPALAATMLPLAQVQRRGTRTSVWGQVRPGNGRQRYVLQRWSAGLLGRGRRHGEHDRRGYLRRTVAAAEGDAASPLVRRLIDSRARCSSFVSRRRGRRPRARAGSARRLARCRRR